MHSLFLVCLVACAAGALAQYNQPAPNPAPQPSYPGIGGGFIWGPSYGHHGGHHGGHWRSSSSSESDESRGHHHKKCNKCKKLKVLKSEELSDMETKKPSIEYYYKNDCRKAVITCPLDENIWFLVVANKDGELQYLSAGQHISAVAKCNKKGKYEAKAVTEDEKVTFSRIICVKQNSASPLPVKEVQDTGATPSNTESSESDEESTVAP